jgi:energy-coupling factor transport system ATP-binding protein
MIRFDQVTITYADAPTPALRAVDLAVAEGEFALVTGGTGSGKSTLLGVACAHVPHFTGGLLEGRVMVGGRDTRHHRPRDLAHVVGVVRQDPLVGFVTDTVEAELAFGMEQVGLAPRVMRTRVEETLDLLGIADLRDRDLRTLSGGQAQRVAIGAVLAAGARVLILDEPTSALDPTSTEEVLAALLRLVHDHGVTALVAEHRLERVLHYADTLILVGADGRVRSGPPAELIATSPLAPPVVELGRLAGWNPLPLSLRDARRQVGPLREWLAAVADGGAGASGTPSCAGRDGGIGGGRGGATPLPGRRSPAGGGEVLGRGTPSGAGAGGGHGGLDAYGIEVDFGPVRAVAGVDLRLAPGGITALMGRNGSGKSSLLWALTGAGPRAAGRWSVDGRPMEGAPASTVRSCVRLVPQTASDLLYLETIDAECAAADAASASPVGTARSILDRILGGLREVSDGTVTISGGVNPRDLSEGQRLAVALAVQLTARAPVLLLDEPTRGLDYRAKAALGAYLTGLAHDGLAVCVATHDVEFAAAVADRVVVMAAGEVVAEGPADEILLASTIFAPQVAKVLGLPGLLTPADVAAALARDAGDGRDG